MLKYFQIWFLFRKNVHVCQNLCGISDTFELVDEVSAVFRTFLSFRKPPVLIKEKLLKYFLFRSVNDTYVRHSEVFFTRDNLREIKTIFQ